MLGESSAVLAVVLGIAAAHVSQVLAWRTILGIGVGICITAKPLYIVEAAPAAWRGRLLTLLALSILIGQVVCEGVDWAGPPNSIGLAISERFSRVEIAISGAFPLLLLLLLYLMPHTPTHASRAHHATIVHPDALLTSEELTAASSQPPPTLESTPLAAREPPEAALPYTDPHAALKPGDSAGAAAGAPAAARAV
jgi:MFS family permease